MSAEAEPKLPGTAEKPTERVRAAASAAKDARPKRRGPGRPRKDEKRAERLAEQIASLGLVLGGAAAVTGSDALADDGVAVVQHAQPIAEALAKLAEENARVAKLLDAGVTSSAWLGVAFAVAPLMLQIAQNHGAVPQQLAGAGVENSAGSVGVENSAGAGTPFAGLSDVLGRQQAGG